ncbi:MAG: LytTR family transcriptional regulator DNA-binding domain-containing protein [Clostridiales bacterium]|nr:LytTR family transcriptional regulator DNA-binding domain-containing protein [Clostridiales bacterium]
MIEILIYDKNVSELNDLKKRLDNIAHSVEYILMIFTTMMDMMDYIHSTHPEKLMVFFVDRDDKYGNEAALRIHSMNHKSRFCLISEEQPEDVEALFLNSVSYYIKSSHDNQKLESCFQSFLEYYDDSYDKVVVLKSKAGDKAIPLHNILYCMSDKRKVLFMEKEQEHEFYYKLDDVEKMLGESFLRCHQSYLVNMNMIERFVEDGLVLTSGDFIPVSRKKYFSSKRAYLSYITDSKEIISL